MELVRFPQEDKSNLLRDKINALQTVVWPEKNGNSKALCLGKAPEISFCLLHFDLLIGHAALTRTVFAQENIRYDGMVLHDVATLPFLRGSGVGTLLLHAACAYLAQSGCDACIFTCPPALSHFFENGGFTADETLSLTPTNCAGATLVMKKFFSKKALYNRDAFHNSKIYLEI